MTPFILSIILAASPITIHYMPRGMETSLRLDGKTEKVRCYVFEDYKKLLKLDTELWTAQSTLGDLRNIEVQYRRILSQKNAMITSLNKDMGLKNKRIARLETLWKESEERTIKATGGPVWPIILAASGVLVGTIGTTLYLSEKFR